MKFKRISQERAETIIVYGKGGGFSQINLLGKLTTIYHRVYENTYYDIAEMEYSYTDDNGNDKELQVFYQFDPVEVKMILGCDPEKITREDIAREKEQIRQQGGA